MMLNQSSLMSSSSSHQPPNMLINNKTDKLENILMPRPLFDKTNAALIKLRRDIKTQKLKGWPNYKLDVIKSSLSMICFYS